MLPTKKTLAQKVNRFRTQEGRACNLEELTRLNGGRSLSGADLTGAHLEGANLRGADLTGVNFTRARLGTADLSDAFLGNVNLTSAYLNGTNFFDSYLGGSTLIDVWAPRANFSRAHLKEASIHGSNFRLANFTDARFQVTEHGGVSGNAGILSLEVGYSGLGLMVPTPEGWRITVGCWKNKTLEDWKDLIDGRIPAPEARGRAIKERKPWWEATYQLCLAHAYRYQGEIEALQEKWRGE